MDRLLWDSSIKVLTFDMKKVNFMDSSGIGMLIGRYKTMKKRDGSMCVSNVGKQMDRVLRISGLYRILNVESKNLGRSDNAKR